MILRLDLCLCCVVSCSCSFLHSQTKEKSKSFSLWFCVRLFPRPLFFSPFCASKQSSLASFVIIFCFLGFEWCMQHSVGKRDLSETSGVILSQTWKRMLSSHCWRGSTTRTAQVVKWIKPKSWVRDKVYLLEIFSSYGWWCCVLVIINFILFCVLFTSGKLFFSSSFSSAILGLLGYLWLPCLLIILF